MLSVIEITFWAAMSIDFRVSNWRRNGNVLAKPFQVVPQVESGLITMPRQVGAGFFNDFDEFSRLAPRWSISQILGEFGKFGRFIARGRLEKDLAKAENIGQG